MIIYEVLRHIRNFFPDLDHERIGEFRIANGVIDPSPLVSNHQYFLIEGSSMNDGVWSSDNSAYLQNEIFYGRIVPLKIPFELLNLIREIEDYESANKVTPYESESFGGYSYTRAKNKSGKLVRWQDAYSTRLNAWRKL